MRVSSRLDDFHWELFSHRKIWQAKLKQKGLQNERKTKDGFTKNAVLGCLYTAGMANDMLE